MYWGEEKYYFYLLDGDLASQLLINGQMNFKIYIMKRVEHGFVQD